MSIRSIGAIAIFLFAFLGLMSMVGSVAVEEFYGCLVIGFIAGLVGFMNLPKPNKQNSDQQQ